MTNPVLTFIKKTEIASHIQIKYIEKQNQSLLFLIIKNEKRQTPTMHTLQLE